jgi:hypothetical protein
VCFITDWCYETRFLSTNLLRGGRHRHPWRVSSDLTSHRWQYSRCQLLPLTYISVYCILNNLWFRGTLTRSRVRVARLCRADRQASLLVLQTPNKTVGPSSTKDKQCSPLRRTADEGKRGSSLWSEPSAYCIEEGTILPGTDITSNIELSIYASFIKQRGRKTCLVCRQNHQELHFTTWQPLSHVWLSLPSGRSVKWYRFETFMQTVLYCLGERTVVSTQQGKCCGHCWSGYGLCM